MLTDKQKYEWSKKTGHLADRSGHINYYNCWHCKRCGSELERICECGELFDEHSFKAWLHCTSYEKEVHQVCPFSCKKIGGLDMFAGKARKINKDKDKKD